MKEVSFIRWLKMPEWLNEQDLSFQAGYAVKPYVIETAIYEAALRSSPGCDKISVGMH